LVGCCWPRRADRPRPRTHPASSAAQPTTAAAKPTTAASGDFQTQWNALEAAAKQEGSLVVGLAPNPPVENTVLPAFQKETGVELQQVKGQTSTSMVTRLIQEQQANTHSTDVIIASCPGAASGLQGGIFAPINSQVILPDANDPSKWAGGKPTYFDPQQTYVLRLDQLVRPHFYVAPDSVSAGDLKTADDLLNPKWKGKIATLDPTIPSAGQDVAAEILKLKGADFLKNLYIGQDVQFAPNGRGLGDWVAHNTYSVGIGLPLDEYQGIKSNGLPISESMMNDPITADVTSVLLIGVVANAPHPNAAKLFVNWALTQGAQQQFADAEGSAMTRTDLDYSKLDPNEIPSANSGYPDACSYAYQTGESQQLYDQVKTLLAH
jgi:iron(III) transport system substrate-binding protein